MHVESVNLVEIAEVTPHINALASITCYSIPYIQYECRFPMLLL